MIGPTLERIPDERWTYAVEDVGARPAAPNNGVPCVPESCEPPDPERATIRGIRACTVEGIVRFRTNWLLGLVVILSGIQPACGGGAASIAPAPAAPAALQTTPLDCSADGHDWPMYGQNVCNTRAVTGGPIGPKTAAQLRVKWTFEAAGDVSATPAVVAGQVYVPDWGGMIHRIDAATGKASWSKSVAAIAGIPADASPSPAGGGGSAPAASDVPAPVVSRVTPVVFGDSVIFGLSRGSSTSLQSFAIVVAVDRATGALKWQTKVDAHPAAVITSSPVIQDGHVYVGVSSGEEWFATLPGYPCCTFRGSVAALDATTGKLLWKTYTIDDSAYYQADGKTPSGFAGAAVWAGTPTVDRKRHSLYVTTGNNYSTPKGVTALPAGDHVESIMALDLDSGAVKWSRRVTTGDRFTIADFLTDPKAGGPDWDFGSGANLFQATIGGHTRDVVGAGQKSGIYWAVDPDSGEVLWQTQVGPGGHLGGIQWGPAVDGAHVYVGVNDEFGAAYTLGGKGSQAGQTASTGSWAALDPSSGEIRWQVANPAMREPLNLASVNGPLAVANGVVFAGSMDAQGTMFAFDGQTGTVLWSFHSGGTVYGGPAIADGIVYWGSGYPASRLRFGTPSHKLYAFHLGL